MGERDISDIFNENGSEKDRNGYLQVYHMLFHTIRTNVVTVLEIGSTAQTSSSLFSLRDYFVGGRIIGINSDPYETLNEPRIETYVCDSTKKEEVEEFVTKLDGVKFDIIIHNGSQCDLEQISTLRNFYTHLHNDGFYIIEGICDNNKLTQCPSLIGCLCNHDAYFFAGIKNNMCIIQKHHLNSKRKQY